MQLSRFHNMSRKEQQGTQSYLKYGTKYPSILAYLRDLQLVASPACYFLNLDEIQKRYFRRDAPVSIGFPSI